MTLACKTRFSRILTLFSYFALLLLFTLWYLLLSPASADHPWVIWLVHLLPLLAFAPIVIRGNPRGHAWLCFVLLIYFMEAVLAALVPNVITSYSIHYTKLYDGPSHPIRSRKKGCKDQYRKTP